MKTGNYAFTELVLARQNESLDGWAVVRSLMGLFPWLVLKSLKGLEIRVKVSHCVVAQGVQ